MSKSIDYFVNKINPNVVSCQDCQPRDNENDEGFFWIIGDRKEISEVLEDYDVPEELWENVTEKLFCPECGCVFDKYSEIGIMDEYEKEYLKKYEKIIKNVSPSIDDFCIYIEKFPYLGANHKTGKRIIKEIKEFPLVTIEKEIYYRARNIETGKAFSRKDMKPPPQNKVTIGEGRFNHFGQSHFYIGCNERLCAWEITNKNESICWMQKIEIVKIENVLDVDQLINPDNINMIPTVFTAIINSDQLNKECEPPRVSRRHNYVRG